MNRRRHRRERVLAVAILTDTFVVPAHAILGCGGRVAKSDPSARYLERFPALKSGVNFKRYSLELAPAPLGSSPSERSLCGKNPLTAWRRPFEVARAKEPILGPLHDIYLRNLRHALGMDEPQPGLTSWVA